MITFMAEVVENRDDNTGGHIRRTAEYVESIAKELKRQGTYSDILTDRYMSDMVVAAPLHDIGKIHIPDAVLNKPGKLTEEEFEIMKTHTTAREELLTHAKEELGESGYSEYSSGNGSVSSRVVERKRLSLWYKRGENTALCEDHGGSGCF